MPKRPPPSSSPAPGSVMDPSVLALGIVDDAIGLAGLAGEWDRLVLAAARPSPFLLHGWVTAWWRAFGGGATLAVVTARRNGVLVGLAPTFVRPKHGLRVCRLLGDHESALGDLLADPSDEGDVAAALMRRLRAVSFDYLDAFGMPEDGILPGLARSAGIKLLRRVESPVLLMPDGWEAAYASRTRSKKRNLHRRRLRQLGELGEVSWTTARTPDEVTAELEHAFAIHARRWEGRPDGSTFGMRDGRTFHNDGAEALAAQGAVRILTLRIGGRPVAFHYAFVLGSTMYLHRLAFDPELARFSPGQVTLLRALADASKEGITRVEFLGGDERYKVELADRFEPMYQAIGLARGPIAAVAVRTIVGIIAMRQRLKRSAWLHDVYHERLAPLRRINRRGR